MAPDARRRLILDAAAVTFAEKPYDDVTISAIARRAQASDALLYRYFESKADLFIALVTDITTRYRQRQEAALDKLPAHTPVRDKIRSATDAYLRAVADDPKLWRLTYLNTVAEAARALEDHEATWGGHVRRLLEMLDAGNGPQMTYAVHGFFGYLDRACVTWVHRNCPAEDRAGLIDGAVAALFGAIEAPTGRA